MSAPNAQTTTAAGRAAAISTLASISFTRSGWATGNPIARAASATGGAASRRPRPRGRSGRVTTSAGRWGDWASRASTVTAKSDVPRKTVRTRRRG